MSASSSLDELWNSAPSSSEIFYPARLSRFPEGARRYLEHAIAPGTPLASSVRLHMRGEIKLNGWRPFAAEQVICWNRGMIWQATVRVYGLTIRGSDRFVDGYGAMRWKLFGIVPIVNAAGPDITKSVAGRVNIESIWLPSVLCGNAVSWTASDDAARLHSHLTAHNETAVITYSIDAEGRLKTVSMPRWGNPEGGRFHYADCGGFVEQERSFNGYTIPTRIRVGWHFGTDRFEPEREFFRATVDDAVYK